MLVLRNDPILRFSVIHNLKNTKVQLNCPFWVAVETVRCTMAESVKPDCKAAVSSTRATVKLHLQDFLCSERFSVKQAKSWNLLPDHLKLASNPISFKSIQILVNGATNLYMEFAFRCIYHCSECYFAGSLYWFSTV